MNAEQLLTHFDRIANAPAAIPRLRRFILDLAVRGKLVEQDPNDEPAWELLTRIAAEKAQLEKAKKIRKQAPFQPPDLNEVSFDLPSSWVWCPSTYPSYIVSDKGKKIRTKDVVETGEFPVVDQGKVLIRGYHNDADKAIRIKAPIVLFGDHTREIKLIDFDFIVGADGVKLLQPVSLYTAYYFLALQWLPLESRGYGRHFKLLKASFIPLPPLAEQHRIVAKVDELMTLCDQLEAARTERETTRDRLTAASLACLDVPDPDPEIFQNHVSFALDNLIPLTTRPDQIKALRQTILNLAVRGKLVEQNPNDEPASELLTRIAAEKAQLEKAKKIRKQAPFQPPDLNEVSFDLPSSWVWCPSTYPSYIVSDKGKKIRTKDVVETGEFPVVDQGKVLIRGYHNDADKAIRIKAPIVLFGDHTREIKLIDFDFIVGADGVKLLQPVSLYTAYYFLALQWLPLESRGYGRHFKLLKASFIPLPPLAEQYRIVAKVDELMALCDQLEASLATCGNTCRCLLDTVLHEALEETTESGQSLFSIVV